MHRDFLKQLNYDFSAFPNLKKEMEIKSYRYVVPQMNSYTRCFTRGILSTVYVNWCICGFHFASSCGLTIKLRFFLLQG